MMTGWENFSEPKPSRPVTVIDRTYVHLSCVCHIIRSFVREEEGEGGLKRDMPHEWCLNFQWDDHRTDVIQLWDNFRNLFDVQLPEKRGVVFSEGLGDGGESWCT